MTGHDPDVTGKGLASTKRRVRIVSYKALWQCASPSCHVKHGSKSAARRCTLGKSKLTLEEIRAFGLYRRQRAAQMREKGMTYRLIGNELGVSHAQARLLAIAGMRIAFLQKRAAEQAAEDLRNPSGVTYA